MFNRYVELQLQAKFPVSLFGSYEEGITTRN